jgi:hypothetical protein
MTTKTVRSRFSHEVGEQVEGLTILEKRVIIPPEPSQRRLGVYDYVVEVPPVAAPPRASHKRSASPPRNPAAEPVPGPESFTRTTPDEMGARVIRRLPGR